MADKINNYGSNVNIPATRGKKANLRKTRKDKKAKELMNFKKELSSIIGKTPDWYLIREIDIADFIYCIKKLFSLMEHYATSEIESGFNETLNDPFMKQICVSQYGMDEAGWAYFESMRKFQHALSQNLGDFHEELAGKFPGYRTLHVGHWSGIDVIKEDKTEFWEFKNGLSYNKASVFKKFKELLDSKYPIKHVVLVHINTPPDWKPESLKIDSKEARVDLTVYGDKIKIVNGRQAYEYLSGSPDFYDRLGITLGRVFSDKSLVDFIKSVDLAMNID
jgi:hypothetical protein